jgi:Tfp pilus assembly protein PilF
VRPKHRNLLDIFLVTLFLTQAGATCGTRRDTPRSRNRVDLAKDYLGKGELEAAETEVKKAVGFDAENEDAYNVWGLIYVVRANNATNLYQVHDCIEGVERDALASEADDNMRLAAEKFDQAIKLGADFGEAYQNRAVVAMHFKDWDRAIELERQALGYPERLDPRSIQVARANLGWAQFQKGNAVQAVKELLQASTPNSGGYFFLGNYRLAEIFYRNEELDRAAERLRPLIEDPEVAKQNPIVEAQFLAGMVYLRKQDHETARKLFEKCKEMAPKSCQARQCEKALAGVP